ncbi:ATP-binding protein [Amycolatopsis sp. NPDC049252]|uniref:ATP-binding protein n=1 Tax=Amycolatopsis sp. NPDC049252 TaxID=3363933 RepID=UPI003724261B
MGDEQDSRNETGSWMQGTVVQSGAIEHASPAGATVAWAGPSWSPPRQLPSAVRDFTGRVEHLAALDARLPGDEDIAGVMQGAVVISAVDGAAGIGKTTLAVWWAHRVQFRFPDGTLYVNLRGYGPGDPATPNEVLDGFLRAFGAPGERLPVEVEARAALFRSHLAGRRVLLVLDNANSADQVRPLLPGTPGCMVIVTSRDSLTGLVVTEGAHRLTLDLLTEPEAQRLVGGIVGSARAAAEPDAVDDLIRLCARLPLALRIAAARATALHTTVADVAAELSDDRYRLDVLSRGGDERAAVRAVFDWSYERLPLEQARTFRYLGVHPGPEISLRAAAAVVDLELGIVRGLLGGLADVHMIEPVGRDRYRLHDLLRTYAVDHIQNDHPVERDQARDRMLNWYAWQATAAFRSAWTSIASSCIPLKSAVKTCPEITFSEAGQAREWFDSEAANLIAAVRTADRDDLHRLTILLVCAISTALSGRGDYDILLELEKRAVAAARRSHDSLAEVHVLLLLVETCGAVALWQEAISIADGALGLARDLGDVQLETWALNELGLLWLEQQQYALAYEFLQVALPLSEGMQNGRMEGVIEGNLSSACTGLGDYKRALRHAEHALVMRRQADDRGGEAYALFQMTTANQGMGRHREAIALCEEALAIEPHHQWVAGTGKILDALGTSLHYVGNTKRALSCWRDALVIYDKYRRHDAADLRRRLRSLDAAHSDG